MKITLSWLKDHLDTTATAEELARGLTALGLVVDSLKNPADALQGFNIVEVVAVQPHPNADKLQVLSVQTGTEILQVVCGDLAVKTGLKGVLARPGLIIPANGMQMRVAKVRDVESHGMMCSLMELGLASESEGVIQLPQEAPVGTAYATYAGLDDPVFDVEITPNRGDAISAYGLARDLAAAGFGTLKALKLRDFSAAHLVRLRCTLTICRIVLSLRGVLFPA